MALLFFLGSSCERVDPQVPKQREDIVLTKSQQQVLENGNDFALRWFAQMRTSNGKENLFLSPLSTSYVLAALCNGADGRTLEQMMQVMGMDDVTVNAMNSSYRVMTSALPYLDNTVDLVIANSLWFNKLYPIPQSFVSPLKSFYDMEVESLDFFSPSSVDIINEWCAQKTHNLIPSILSTLSPQTVLVIANALYFKGMWTFPFDKDRTTEGPFHNLNGTDSRVRFMQQKNDFAYYEDDRTQVVELPYGNEAFSLVVMLPAQGVSAPDWVNNLDGAYWTKLVGGLRRREMTLKMPKFKMEYNTEDLMIPVLTGMGMGDAFSGTLADFSKIGDDLFISLMKQKTFIEVDEKGTEAAAVTVVAVEETSVGPTTPFHLLIDSPFVYAIREKSTGAILFLGLMTTL